ncbi:MAG: SH3 domain-containing protein, partial [Gallionellaceae bacterium]|nr:SH3 domain-containing protein [Gallionellaceae bacterium]
WTQVKAGTASGWVRMLSLRYQTTTSGRGDGGLGALFNVAKTGKSGSTVTTGVRGLSEEQLKNARPNPKELERAKEYSAEKAEARKHAKTGKLEQQDVDYMGGR